MFFFDMGSRRQSRWRRRREEHHATRRSGRHLRDGRVSRQSLSVFGWVYICTHVRISAWSIGRESRDGRRGGIRLQTWMVDGWTGGSGVSHGQLVSCQGSTSSNAVSLLTMILALNWTSK